MFRRLSLILLLVLAPALAAAQTYTISPPPFLLAQNNSGAIVNNACIWTYTAGTTSVATTYATSTGTTNSNPIRSDSAGRFTAYLSPGTSYKFVYESACTPPAHGTVFKTADNISAMPTSAASVDITGTAGESITAGQCVYLSAGDGGKTPTQWYKCDSANTYSATTNDVGIATVNIASGGTGTIRTNGSVSSLTVSGGLKYYVGTAGALTSTAPTNARLLGQADSATSLVLTGNPPGVAAGGAIGQVWTNLAAGAWTAQSQGFFDDFRLSLTTATCVTTTDVTAATTLYWTPCTGNRITLFDTSGNPETCTTAEISIAVPATTSQMYDVWVYDNGTFGTGCTPALELLAWTNDTTRATATTKTSGSNWRWTKSGNTSRMYVGSFRTTTVSGQTEDSVTKRYVWNQYNRVRRHMVRQEATANWNYSTATIRQANGAAANQLDFVIGQNEVEIEAWTLVYFGQTSVGVIATSGIGLDSTSAFNCAVNEPDSQQSITTGQPITLRGHCAGSAGVGKHFVSWNEYSAASATTTFYGTGNGANAVAGISAWLEN